MYGRRKDFIVIFLLTVILFVLIYLNYRVLKFFRDKEFVAKNIAGFLTIIFIEFAIITILGSIILL